MKNWRKFAELPKPFTRKDLQMYEKQDYPYSRRDKAFMLIGAIGLVLLFIFAIAGCISTPATTGPPILNPETGQMEPGPKVVVIKPNEKADQVLADMQDQIDRIGKPAAGILTAVNPAYGGLAMALLTAVGLGVKSVRQGVTIKKKQNAIELGVDTSKALINTVETIRNNIPENQWAEGIKDDIVGIQERKGDYIRENINRLRKEVGKHGTI